MNQAKIAEVIVFGYKNESVIASVLPNFLVRCSAQADEAHMGTIEIFNIEPYCELEAEIFAEEKLHAAKGPESRRSRSAAKTSTARMCSDLTSGKSARMSASPMPPARYSSTSETVMLVPAICGLPLRMAGSITMKSCQDICK